MTSLINRKVPFAAITGMGGPAADPLVALAGPRHTILRAGKSGGQMIYLGESEDLGAEVLAANNETIPNYHVLTAAGAVIVDNADSPQIVTESEFDPGGGRWLALFGGAFLVTPLAKGGVQALNATTLVKISQLPGVASDSRFAYGYNSNNVIYVADTVNATIVVLKVSATGVLHYVGKVRAPNCRDVIKVVLDEDNGNLFVVCRRRIVRFTVPLASVTDEDDLLPTFAEDYGVATADYSDLVVIGENQYWIAQSYPTSATPLDAYYGPLFGAWDDSINELFVAAPKGAIWTVNDVIPYYTEDTVDETTDPPVPPVVDPPVEPPVILPDPPVITSLLTSDGFGGEAWTYTITASGTGPITFSATGMPAWMSLNMLTGVLSGTPTGAEVDNIQITATNIGGSDTETLVLTVVAIDWSLVALNGDVQWMVRSGDLVYCVGTFTTVTDASGTVTRNRAACINILTALWQAWNPNLNGAGYAVEVFGAHVYVGGTFTTVGGTGKTYAARVDPTSGALDNSWTPLVNAFVGALYSYGGLLYIGGGFNSVFGSTREGNAAFDATGALHAFRANDAGARFLTGGVNSIQAFNGAIAMAGGSSFQLLTSTPGIYRCRGYGMFDAATGQAAQMANGYTPGSSSLGAGSSQLFIGGAFTSDWLLLSNNSPLGVTRNLAAAVSASGTLSSFNPNLGVGNAPEDLLPMSDGGCIAVGNFPSVGGDTSKRMMSRLDAAGAPVPGFAITFGSAVNPIYRALSYGPAVIIGGGFSTTINGVSRTGIAAVNAATGNLY